MRFLSTPKRAARVITKVALNQSGETGTYYDEHGDPMQGSEFIRTPGVAEQIVAETRSFLAASSA